MRGFSYAGIAGKNKYSSPARQPIGLMVIPMRRMRPELSHNKGVVTLDTLRTKRREEILRLAERHGAHSVRVFGSVARGDANEKSDLDLLVAWEPGRSLLDHVGFVQDLQELLGVKVHVGTEQSLHWYVRNKILREATPL